MLAEKFCLLLEALRERNGNNETRVQSTSPHIPVTLPVGAQQPTTASRRTRARSHKSREVR
jgi:hypothetical protein